MIKCMFKECHKKRDCLCYPGKKGMDCDNLSSKLLDKEHLRPFLIPTQ
jgi:hypothetical protein